MELAHPNSAVAEDRTRSGSAGPGPHRCSSEGCVEAVSGSDAVRDSEVPAGGSFGQDDLLPGDTDSC
jgi:hypothetical protein